MKPSQSGLSILNTVHGRWLAAVAVSTVVLCSCQTARQATFGLSRSADQPNTEAESREIAQVEEESSDFVLIEDPNPVRLAPNLVAQEPQPPVQQVPAPSLANDRISSRRRAKSLNPAPSPRDARIVATNFQLPEGAKETDSPEPALRFEAPARPVDTGFEPPRVAREVKREEPSRVTANVSGASVNKGKPARLQFGDDESTIDATPLGHCLPGSDLTPEIVFGPDCNLEYYPAIVAEGEYVCNGGDRETQVRVKKDWTVQGLHPGDTVIHYDTIDGQTRVQPSNDVCLYAPRFAAVRKVYGMIINEGHDRPAGVDLPLRIVQGGDVGEPTTVVQPLQPGRSHSIGATQQFVERALGQGLDNAQLPAVAEEYFLPYEDLSIIRRGKFDNTEKARLAARLEAAIEWTSDQGPQVIIDNKTAIQMIGTTQSRSVYEYELPPGKSRVRIVKIASRHNARPGDVVEFTIRFDNVGDRVIGNVTILDRLHDRLELVPDSQRCSLPADFFTEDEEGSPRVLRWEIKEPLEVGEGGIIRFQCRVR